MTQEANVPASQAPSEMTAETPEESRTAREPREDAPAPQSGGEGEESGHPKWLPPHHLGFEAGTDACMVCEWCHTRPGEYEEPNHDCVLCRTCAFDVAPSRPIETEGRFPPYSKPDRQTLETTPEKDTFRIVVSALELLALTQGCRFGSDYVESIEDEENPRIPAISALCELLDLVRFIRLPYDDWTGKGYEAAMEEFLGRIREKLLLCPHKDQFLFTCLAVVRVIDARNPEAERAALETVMEELSCYVGFLPLADLETNPLPPLPPPSTVPPRRFAAQSPRQHRSRREASDD